MDIIKKYGFPIAIGFGLLIVAIYMIMLGSADSQEAEESAVTFVVNFSYYFVIIAVIIMLLLPLILTLKNPKSLIKIGVAVGIVLVIFLIGYGIADVEKYMVTDMVTEGDIKWSGGLLNTAYILLILTFLSMVGGELYKAIKS